VRAVPPAAPPCRPAATTTQFGTRLCCSESGPAIDAIDRLDAEATSIEAARSRMEAVRDIRSIDAAKPCTDPACGLKTRGYDETTASLRAMVAAATTARAALTEATAT
jgi:5-methyltetrahydropteroyltriglutamate--homocysteine methyltransferase